MSFFIGDIDILEDERLSANDKLVYFALACYMNRATGTCFPRMATIAKRVGISRCAVSRAVTHLQSLKIISKKRLSSTNEYSLERQNLLLNSNRIRAMSPKATTDVANSSILIRPNIYNQNTGYRNYNSYKNNNFSNRGGLIDTVNITIKYNNKDLKLVGSEGLEEFYKDKEGKRYRKNKLNNKIVEIAEHRRKKDAI
jgi:hypothetical protein